MSCLATVGLFRYIATMKALLRLSRSRCRLFILLPLLSLLSAAALPAQQAPEAGRWPNFRGPHLDGSADAAGVASDWSLEAGLLWSASLPGVGSSTPAIWDGRIFLTSAGDDGQLLAMCLDAADGRVLWQHVHGRNRRQGRNDMTSPSPVTDGETVIFLFGTGEMAAYDVDGSLRWTHHLAEAYGPLAWLFGYGASPLLYDGRLYVQMMRRPTHRDAPAGTPLASYVLAFDPATGEELWRQVRPGEAQDESWESYVTPAIHDDNSRAQLVLAGADAVTGHDPLTGRELWRRDFNARRLRNWRLVPTPVSDGRHVFMAVPRGVSLVAFDPAGSPGGVKANAAWTLSANAPDVCSPLLYAGRLYVLDGDRRVMTCLDPATGRTIWRGELGGGTVIRASPTAADGKLFVMDEDGLVFVLEAGDTFRVLSRIDMGGGQPARSSISIADGRLYIRTASALHCVAPLIAAGD